MYLTSLVWRHNDQDGVSNNRRLDDLPNRFSSIDQRKRQSSASLAFVRGIHPVTGEFLSQRASNAGNVSVWWRHHVENVKQGNVRCN